MSLLESIVHDLRRLPPPLLLEISRHIHRLQAPDTEAALRRRAALRATAGSMPGEEARTSSAPCVKPPTALTGMSEDARLLDSSVVIRHFRQGGNHRPPGALEREFRAGCGGWR